MSAPLLAYYGDDLTGSTDVMEALELRGIRTVLFTAIPDKTLLERFSGHQAFGIAGTSRSETPQWMDAHLPPIFRWLDATGAAICHYKVCSTFDSSPEIGSIGRALDLGAEVFKQSSVPIVVGAPQLRRWTAFGNLFADFRGKRFRIDRHPVMSRHPVTPMDEADLRRHLARQTDRTIALVDCATLISPEADRAMDAALAEGAAVLLDVIDAFTQAEVGRQLWRKRGEARFVVGSSGVQYALSSDAAGTPFSGSPRNFAAPGGAGPIAVVSGSCSPTTSRQIRYALQNGFAGVAVDAAALSQPGAARDAEIARTVEGGLAALEDGRSVVLYSALEGEIPVDKGGGSGGHLLGLALGTILSALIGKARLKRVLVAGGDTSSHAMAAMGIAALECRTPIPGAPGSPLCIAHSATEESSFEVTFKGGQVGGDDYFALLRDL
ncbi:four-carbon acid sugar kinase family protein [Chelativorans sp. Marseille-P2723]|uniref:four-carbon acid sugar kinase family protein n=1 Tax=Chelativorans sp. Marseille-P2723 TaxID=2709133 RepID=UPI00156D534F|nr:four-carbon acid sugar kinase family protein [Chelativorans sp. Marseille-P2723]